MCEAVESAVVILGSPNTVGHSPKARCARRDGSSDETATARGLGEGQVTELVEDDEVAAGRAAWRCVLVNRRGFRPQDS